MATFTDDLALAHVLADTADSISMSRFKALDLRVDSKPDMTPVSDADTAVEQAIAGTLSRTRPRDALLGEEFGERRGKASGSGGLRRWVVDPIDGTANYVRGVPVWATLIALLEGDEPVVGLVSAPALKQRWWAAKGGGAYAGRQRSSATAIAVSGVTKLSDASLSYSSIGDWSDREDAFLGLTRRVWRTRAYGDFYSYVLLAEGAVDIAAEPDVSLWDLAALVPIVTEAGGRFTDLAGNSGPAGGSAVATNGPLHAEVLASLTPSRAESVPHT
ncbi:histidinol-phosphatase [Fodinicola acaciae]|uniref:histidinol-phosphatase n=1 Tax=Fodinicola acaciae TaxID=2681555 RepID=UPI0013D76E05|nr:histidinol-phosphatase [Fodinicola acaciae]